MGENCMSNRLNNKNEYISLVTMRRKNYSQGQYALFFIQQHKLVHIFHRIFFAWNHMAILLLYEHFHFYFYFAISYISYFALLGFDICIVRMVFLYPYLYDSYCIGKDVLARYFWHFFLQNIK